MYSQPYYIKFQEMRLVSFHRLTHPRPGQDRRGGGGGGEGRGGRCARIRGGTVTVGYVPVNTWSVSKGVRFKVPG